MGQNSTEVAYGFGQFGSTFMSGDGAILDLTGTTAKYYVCAITMLTDVQFGGTGASGLIPEEAQNFPSSDGASTSIDADGGVAVDSETFPKGVTIYGRYIEIDLTSGMCIAYIGE